jgi:hypothetical protein
MIDPLIALKEATEKSVTLDDDPIMLARLIQTCYTGDYGSATFENILPVMVENALFLARMRGVDHQECQDNEPSGCVLHARMYALSDKYDVSSVRPLAVSKFQTRLTAEDVTSDEVLEATKIIYNSTASHDDTLRKHVVYYAQTNMLEIHKKPAFQELMADLDFAWDFGTRYSSRAHFWCPRCTDWTKISVSCGCGFHGLCGKSEACNNQDWAVLKCAGCKKSGQLLRDQPNEDTETPIIGMEGATKKGSMLMSPPPTPKKRKC